MIGSPFLEHCLEKDSEAWARLSTREAGVIREGLLGRRATSSTFSGVGPPCCTGCVAAINGSSKIERRPEICFVGERLRIEKNDPNPLEYHQWLSLAQRIRMTFVYF